MPSSVARPLRRLVAIACATAFAIPAASALTLLVDPDLGGGAALLPWARRRRPAGRTARG